ncbi:MAG: UDP-N-acetylmuramoyl-L-alanine--D-glutamate ligase [Gemmiger sp.]|uniref:UDP-N-acetylmuramoyl-L-alanine--D-glutamate ligase n=1 Tax=Gemmiger sp. TaxID=2049027 RepID=UPI002E790AA5|nr:UDP-N-acetylmuramoyl-L-alanine--D-glutamate ligase [Gemmiger sp.]MEE0497009.1 UDP-N-acetylmuramoyl-L-alanine--D-glutamate ligase [Gemmiger sp.]
MLPIEQLQNLIQGKKVAFIGAGVSHKRCIEQFVELGAQVTLCDQKKSLEDFGAYADTLRRLHVRLSLGEHYTDGFAGQDIIMRTPGYEYYKPELQAALQAGTKVTSEVELFFELCPCEIVAVTGSDGKTTTTTLISKMFEAAGRKVFLGGNIGAALLPQLADVTPEAVAVVELSSFQLISMRVSPKVAVVTNVTPNHLDHHKDMQEYIDAKRNILLWQVPPCRAVLGFENEISRGMQKDCKGEQVWFTRLHDTDKGAFLRESDDTLCYAENGVVTPILPRAEVKLRGLHNVENLLAAIAAVWGRVPVEAMRQVGSTFTGVEHRIEPVRTLDGVTYYNDSIASSPTRTIAGLRSFNQKIILIAGGYDKKIPYEPLAPEILAHVKTLVLMGATGPRIEAAVRACPSFDESALTILHADSMQHAVELARGAAQPGDVVSLSPASASFDLYPNFEVRGRDYKNIVNNLK